MILLLFVLGFFVFGVIFAPAFLVAVMKLTVLMVFCYIITLTFMKVKEISYLIVILYVFAVVTMAAQAIGPKIDSINQKIDKIERFTDRAERIVR